MDSFVTPAAVLVTAPLWHNAAEPQHDPRPHTLERREVGVSVPASVAAKWYGAYVMVTAIPDVRKLARKINADTTGHAERAIALRELEQRFRQLATATRHERLALKADPQPMTEAEFLET